jgi:hypothetical protein
MVIRAIGTTHSRQIASTASGWPGSRWSRASAIRIPTASSVPTRADQRVTSESLKRLPGLLILCSRGARDAQALHAAVQGLARQPEVGRGLGDDAARARQRLHDGLAVRLRIGAAAGAPGRGQRRR